MPEISPIWTIIVTLLVGLFGGGGIYRIWDKKSKAEAVGQETDNYTKLTKLIKETVQESAQKSEALTVSNDENARLKMTNDVLSGTIETNNKFMKEVLIGWGEMKKSEEICQKNLAELKGRVEKLEQATV